MPKDAGDGGANAARFAVEWMFLRGKSEDTGFWYLDVRRRQLEHICPASEAIQGVLLQVESIVLQAESIRDDDDMHLNLD